MALLPRNTNPSRSSSFHFPRYIPLLLFFSLFIFLILYNVGNFVSRTKQIVQDELPQQTRPVLRQESQTEPQKEQEPHPDPQETLPKPQEALPEPQETRVEPQETRTEPQQEEATIPEEKRELGPMEREFEITWGDGRAQFHDNGTLLTLSLDQHSGSGFRSKDEYMFGKIEMQIKLIAGNSAGTVTTYYLTSPEGPGHDEIDFEFLGNSSGDPYTLHTNVYCEGKGNREEQFYLWFDPTSDFHTYSILWNPRRIVFSVDGIPIREFKNSKNIGVPFPSNKPMKVYSSLWNADDWATQGGRVKADWSKAPFVASYRNYKVEACVWLEGKSSCDSNPPSSWFNEKVDSSGLEKMKWVQKDHRVYNYCVDKWRFPEGLPLECKSQKNS